MLALLIICCVGPPVIDAQASEIIEIVALNELLYISLSGELREDYVHSGASGLPHMTARSSKTTTFDTENERQRVETRQSSTREDGNPAGHSKEYVFDGKDAARLYVGGHHTLYQEGEPSLVDRDVFRPHMALFKLDMQPLQLSEWLSGIEYTRGGYEVVGIDSVLTVTYGGKSKVDDWDCEQIVVGIGKKSPPKSRYVLDLAVDHNLLPVQVLFFSDKYSRDLPVTISKVEELKVAKPNVSVPMKLVTTQYNKSDLMKGEQVVRWVSTKTVERIAVDPPIDDSIFQMPEPPIGAIAQSVNNGQATSTGVVGDRPRREVQGRRPTNRTPWILGLTAASVVVVVILLRRGRS